jgi:hypothetical protein
MLFLIKISENNKNVDIKFSVHDKKHVVDTKFDIYVVPETCRGH